MQKRHESTLIKIASASGHHEDTTTKRSKQTRDLEDEHCHTATGTLAKSIAPQLQTA